MNSKITLRWIIHPALCAGILFAASGCGIYGSFKTPQYADTAEAYGGIESADTTSTGDIGWREFFRDEQLRALIDTALVRNADLQVAGLRVEEAQASLRTAKLAFLPSFELSPSATYDGSWYVQLPVSASWQIDLFGSLRNAKKGKLAAMMQSASYAQAVRTELIATVATTYYTLLALDAQQAVYEETERTWKQNVEAMRRLMQAGRYNAASVQQTEADYCNVLNNLVNVRQQINETENRLCSLMGWTPRTVERGTFDAWTAPETLRVGVPVRVLAARPDVRQAEFALAQSFYATTKVHSAMYPSLTVSGSYDFRHALYEAVGAMVMPLFRRGELRANLKIAKAQQAEAEASFRQTLVDAGVEVNDAFIAVKCAREKSANYTVQIGHLEDAVKSTQLLMQLGSTTYLEVLTAQQSLLTAQIGQIANRLTEISGTITLYEALGGGLQ